MRTINNIAFALALAFALAVVMDGIGKPDRPDPAPKKEPPPPMLASQCQFGQITQDRRKITIVGPDWTAAGEIRPDGMIFLVWARGTEGGQAVALYKLDKGNLIGEYAYCDDDGHIDEMGRLVGFPRIPETLYLTEPKVDQ